MANTNSRSLRSAFTMVEVIVVAVLVAILAAVAIPQYQSYVEESRQEAVDNLAESGAAIANSIIRRKGDITIAPADLGLSYDDTKYVITISGDNVVVTELNKSPAKVGTRSFR